MMRPTTTEPLGLKPFLEALDTALGELSHEQLKTLILQEARTLRPRERAAFLSQFQTPPAASKTETTKAPAADKSLLPDIDEFISNVKSGMYYDGWGWDHEIHDERAFGDESWVEEMDALFDRAESDFMEGHLENAGVAYGKLLNAFSLQDDGCAFSGQQAPDEMLDTDIGEAKARYFRCLYLASDAGKRVGALAEAAQELEYVGDRRVGIQAMLDSASSELPGFDAFIGAWIDMLKTVRDPSGFGWGYTARWLLREAVRIANGTDGLAALANEQGNRHPDAFMDWVTALVDDNRTDEAIKAAKLGVDRISSPEAKAVMADRLAELAEGEKDKVLMLGARHTAWQSDPNMLRILLYLNSIDDSNEREAALQAEYDQLDKFTPKLSSRLSAMLEICTGRYADALARLKKSKPLGWSSGSHVGLLVMPFALLAATSDHDWQSQKALSVFIRELDELSEDGICSLGELELMAKQKKRASTLSILQGVLALHPLDETDSDIFMASARSTARKRIKAIVSNCHRGAYERAAILAVAVSEAEKLVEGTSPARQLAVMMYKEFNRHSAFRRELMALMPGLQDM